MSTPAGLVLLDTGILIQLARGNRAGLRLDRDLSLSTRPERPIISVVTVGEVRAFARKLGWGDEKRRRLDELVRQLVIVDIRDDAVLHRYAAIDHYSEREAKPARPMGQNDMWIAACSSVYDAHLVTADKDFDHLTPRFVGRTRVDGVTGAVLDTTGRVT